MLVLSVLVAVYYILIILYFRYLSTISGGLIKTFTVQGTAVMVLLTGELLLYWNFQDVIYRKLWANIYVLALYAAFILLPVLAGAAYLYVYNMGGGNAELYIREVNKIRFGLFWSFLVLGHVFFILLISKGIVLRKKKLKEPEDTDDDLLSEFRE